MLEKEATMNEHLEHSLQVVALNAAQMRRTLESPQGKLLVGVKQATTMLGELMTSKLSPRSYYELYNSCFDALSQLQEYLLEDHSNHHLADVYEIVEYVSNVLPRLYLMITVGTAFLASGDAPKTEVLKDMLEMARGIQSPLRGLFLRYYLGQRTGDFLIGNKVDSQFSVQFTLTNFIEMNKLWVRYQYQGHSSGFDQRLQERIQLQTIVGSSILRLSQLDAVDISLFCEQILPSLLDQIVQCRDKLAQEYLLDIIVHVFPAEFHLETLGLFLDSIEYLSPETSTSTILLVSMYRIMQFAESKKAGIQLENAMKKASMEDNQNLSKAVESDKNDGAETSSQQDVPKNDEKSKISDESPLPTKEESTSHNREELEHTTSKSNEHLEELSDERARLKPDNNNSQTESRDINVGDGEHDKRPSTPSKEPLNNKLNDKSSDLSVETSEAESNSSSIIREAIQMYWDKIRRLQLDVSNRARLVQVLLKLSKVTESALSLSEIFGYVVSDQLEESKEVELLLLSLFETEQDFEAIMELLRKFPLLLSSQSKKTRHEVAERIINQVLTTSHFVSDFGQTKHVLELFSTLLRSGEFEPSKIAQFVRLIRANSISETLELFQLAHKTLREGGRPVVQKTSSVIIYTSLSLLKQSPEAVDVARIMKFVNKVCHDLASVGDSPFHAFCLYITCTKAADCSGAEEAAYELFAQAFTLYEELITDSYQQTVALAIAIQALQHTTVFTSMNYEPLARRCTQYGQRLLKKPDQCRTLLRAAHLYWDNDYSDAVLVEETLNRALRSADSVMDINTSIELFLDVLDEYCYFLANETTTVTTGAVNNIVNLIKENFVNAKKDNFDDESNLKDLEARFNRIKNFTKSQVSAFPRFEGIEI